ncbi:MAG: hypothetical protein ACK4TA_04720 [Saprospiraceae bacterium]
MNAGIQQIMWNAQNQPLQNGTYFYRLLIDHKVMSQQIVLVR